MPRPRTPEAAEAAVVEPEAGVPEPVAEAEPAAPEAPAAPPAPAPPAPAAVAPVAPPPPPPPAAPAAPTAPPAPAVASDKNRVVAGVLGILLGWLGVHKFYLGYTKEGIILAAATIVTFGFLSWATSIIGLIEGIIYLTKTDEEFVATYVTGQKPWF